MKRIPLSALALLASCLIAAPASAAAVPPEVVERSDRVAEARGLTALEIDDASGTVQVSPSPDGRIHVRATKICRSADAALARRLAAEAGVEAGPVGGRYVVRAIYPHRIEAHMDFWDLFSERGRQRLRLPSVEVRLAVEVPAGLPVGVETGSGDVRADGLASPLEIRSTSGDLALRSVRAPVRLFTTSGDLDLADVGRAEIHTTSGDLKVAGIGALDYHSSSGDAEIDGARGGLRVETESGDVVVADAPAGLQVGTVSGDVTVRGACGPVSLHSVSGDIEARLRGPLAETDIESTSGELTVAIVPGLGAVLESSTTSGTIDCQLPVTVIRHGPNSLDARLGSGGAHIRLRTTSSDVNITSGGR